MNFRGLELEDQPWFPETIKESMTDYLRFIFQNFNLYQPVIPLLNKALDKCKADKVIDLCSGSGGPIENIRNAILHLYNKDIQFVLTDLYPRIDAYQHLSKKTHGIVYIDFPVDAANVPASLTGFRTMFSGIHHFGMNDANAVIQSSVKAKQGIAIFDGGDKNLFIILLIILLHPLAFLLFSPFFKPFRWSRLFFTYLIPIVPITTVWDGVISILNLYKPSVLLEIAKKASDHQFSWEAGKVKNRYGMKITYLIGTPL